MNLLKEEKYLIVGLVLLFSVLIDMKILVFSFLFYVSFYLTIKYKKYGINYFKEKIRILKFYILNPNKLLEEGVKLF